MGWIDPVPNQPPTNPARNGLEGTRSQPTRYSGQFDTTAKMDDAVAILARAGECFGDVCDLATFRDLARGLERYLVQLMFWVDRQIPWSAVSDLVHGYRLRTAK